MGGLFALLNCLFALLTSGLFVIRCSANKCIFMDRQKIEQADRDLGALEECALQAGEQIDAAVLTQLQQVDFSALQALYGGLQCPSDAKMKTLFASNYDIAHEHGFLSSGYHAERGRKTLELKEDPCCLLADSFQHLDDRRLQMCRILKNFFAENPWLIFAFSNVKSSSNPFRNHDWAKGLDMNVATDSFMDEVVTFLRDQSLDKMREGASDGDLLMFQGLICNIDLVRVKPPCVPEEVFQQTVADGIIGHLDRAGFLKDFYIYLFLKQKGIIPVLEKIQQTREVLRAILDSDVLVSVPFDETGAIGGSLPVPDDIVPILEKAVVELGLNPDVFTMQGIAKILDTNGVSRINAGTSIDFSGEKGSVLLSEVAEARTLVAPDLIEGVPMDSTFPVSQRARLGHEYMYKWILGSPEGEDGNRARVVKFCFSEKPFEEYRASEISLNTPLFEANALKDLAGIKGVPRCLSSGEMVVPRNKLLAKDLYGGSRYNNPQGTTFSPDQQIHMWHIVTELMKGAPAETFINHKLPVQRIVKIMMKTLGIFSEIHARGYVHGDVSGGNILIDEANDDDCGLCDFGGTVKVNPEMRTPLITFPYVPIHYFSNGLPSTSYHGVSVHQGPPASKDKFKGCCPERDLYGLGILFYQMLGKKIDIERYFDSPDYSFCIAREIQKALDDLPSSLSSSLQSTQSLVVANEISRIITKMLNPKKNECYHSAQEIIDDLMVILPHVAPPAED